MICTKEREHIVAISSSEAGSVTCELIYTLKDKEMQSDYNRRTYNVSFGREGT